MKTIRVHYIKSGKQYEQYSYVSESEFRKIAGKHTVICAFEVDRFGQAIKQVA